MTLLRGGIGSHPDNGTPHMEFRGDIFLPDTVVLSLTNGFTFGLLSVDLADTFAPSSDQLQITFNGIKSDNSVVVNTFTTPGGGASTFQTYTFDSTFASDLVRVEIPSQIWAMDNLAFGNVIPEPSTWVLLVAGVLAMAVARQCRKALK
jgi:hypothetical protein